MAKFLLMLLLTGNPAPQAAPSPVAGFEGIRCVPGFCPVAPARSVPGGAMFLALGLVIVGVAGLKGRRPGRPS